MEVWFFGEECGVAGFKRRREDGKNDKIRNITTGYNISWAQYNYRRSVTVLYFSYSGRSAFAKACLVIVYL